MRLACLISVLLAHHLCSGQYQSKLEYGSYTVGFQSVTHFDKGRPPLNEQLQNVQNGRAVHVSIWYPAAIKTSAKPMTFQEYIDPLSLMINPGPVTVASRRESARLMNFFMSQLGADTILFNKHLPLLSKSSTKAFLNAPKQLGAFPVVIYPESPHLSSLLCEYIASHGYIVVNVSRFGTLTSEFEWQNVRGIENLVQDCQFALGAVKDEFKLNDPKVAVMGVGMNASAGLAWMMRNPKIESLVSLEGGIITGYEYELIQKSPYFDIVKVDKPMLVFHSPHEAVNPALINQYKYANRYMMYVPGLREFYYLNFGVWESTMKNILGPAPGDTQKGFEVVANYTLYFLDWQLKNNEAGKAYFEKIPLQIGIREDMATLEVKPAALIPPSQAELELLFSKQGMDALVVEVNNYLNQDSTAISFETFFGIGQSFIVNKEYDEGLKWARIFQEYYPQSISGYTIGGRCNLELGNKKEALLMYNKALVLIPNDNFLDQESKGQMKTAIEKRIEQLNNN